MREKASTIFVCAALALTASIAQARPAKPAHHAAPATKAHAVAANTTHKGARAAKLVKVAESRHHAAPSLHERASHLRVASVAHHHLAPAPAVHEREQEDPTPVEASSPEPHVKHNRKLHLSEPDDAPAAADTAHKLTSDDFMAASATREAATAPTPKPTPTPRPVELTAKSAPAPVLPARNIKAAIATIADDAPKPAAILMPALFDRRGRLIVPAAMKGSHEILLHQNEVADEEHLTRVQDDDDLDRLRGAHQIVALPTSAALAVDERLPANRRFCRPWTAQFLSALAHAHYARFHSTLQVNSAVRTVAFQERLRYTNGNAAPSEGATASPHLTGQAVDLAKHGLSMTEIAWLRGYLLPLVQQGKVDVEEEFQQSCFHISVYKKYLPQATPKRDIDHHRTPATALAAAIR